MVKFTIEEIRALMDFKHNIRNMSGAYTRLKTSSAALDVLSVLHPEA